jgi:TolB-like protein
MGIVWLARDEELERDVALKFLPDLIIQDAAVLSDLKRETRRCLELTHKHIVRIYDFVHDERSGCISMEYIDGDTLSSLRCDKERKVFETAELTDWMSQLCDALDYAHNYAHIVHRDLKPANLMVNQRGELKVSDFGIARSLSDSMSAITMVGGRSGTLSYMSPQQLGGERGTHLDDIYSLGATVYELLTSKPPFYSGNIDRQIREKIPTSMTARRKEFEIEGGPIPAVWEQWVAACLAKDPGSRPRSVDEIARQLQLRKPKARPPSVGVFFQRTKKRVLALVLASLCLVALGAWYFGIFKRGEKHGAETAVASQAQVGPAAAASPGPAIAPKKSIAVLPFENLSKDEENAFFAGGVQDEILSDLAKIADLKVISRTSVMKYKSGPERNLREIAKTLDVSHVVEGSVQRAGGRVRVNVQLIDARNDAHVWAEHYDRDVADIFAVQSEIAQRIADQLRATLSEAEKAAIAERPTADPVAYAYYTKAKEMDLSVNWEGDEKSLNQKLERLEKAIQRDPNFALAYCELAKTHIDILGAENRGDNEKQFEPAKSAAETALRLRPDLGEAHLELARYYFYVAAGTGTNDYNRARDELAIVRQKLPNNAEALMIEGRIARHENRWDASLADLQKANEFDPRNDEIVFFLGQIYFEMRRYSEYEQLHRKQAARGSLDDLFVQITLAQLKLAQGDPVAAQSLLEQVPMDYSPEDWVWNIRFEAALYLRDYDAADRVIAATPAKWADFAFGEQTSSWAEGQVARARGDKQAALAAFAAARKKLDATFSDKPKDAIYWSNIATLDAGLGQKEDAIREARRAVELLPIAKDAVNAPALIANLALVYAWTGERDLAVEQLEKVATLPGAMGTVPTYGDLRFNPCWDELRGDKRFDKIVAAAKAASR